MSETPLVSVVMPLYNGERWVGAALESVVAAASGFPKGIVEVVIADDGSTDDTMRVVSSFSNDLDLRILPTVRLGSWVRSTNRGVSEASGEWISFLHQDDVWLPNRLATIRDLQAGADLILTSSTFIDDGGAELGSWLLPWPDTSIDAEGLAQRLYVQNFLSVPSVAVRRDVLASVGALVPELWYTADWDLWFRLAKVARVRSTRQSTVGFRVHSESQTSTGSADLRDFRSQLETVLDRYSSSAAGPRERAVRRAGRASIELNVALAALGHGQRPSPGALAGGLLPALSPAAGRRLLRDSRIVERAGARVRLRLRERSGRRRDTGREQEAGVAEPA